jgi:hypothetical protein
MMGAGARGDGFARIFLLYCGSTPLRQNASPGAWHHRGSRPPVQVVTLFLITDFSRIKSATVPRRLESSPRSDPQIHNHIRNNEGSADHPTRSRARSTRLVGSVRDREISSKRCRCSASVGGAITRRDATTGSPNPIPIASYRISAKLQSKTSTY